MDRTDFFRVSVIIPVYNVAHFVEEAVVSALHQPEVGEVILIEDGSSDNSLEVCKILSLKFERVRLLTHPQGKNRGVCHSRNLGIRNAQFDFVAFLDADDWYLPNRFVKEKEIFENPEAMAVYSLSAIQHSDGNLEYFGYREDISKKTKTSDVKSAYDYIMRNDVVLGHTNANTFRKIVFNEVGFFDSRLKLHQDTELWNRVARKYLFWAGELKRPVSVARRHNSNRITSKSVKSQLQLLFVKIDNVGLDNLYPSEKDSFVYLYSRAISNPIRWNLLRKVIFHISLRLLGIFQGFFIPRFYQSFQNKNS